VERDRRRGGEVQGVHAWRHPDAHPEIRRTEHRVADPRRHVPDDERDY